MKRFAGNYVLMIIFVLLAAGCSTNVLRSAEEPGKPVPVSISVKEKSSQELKTVLPGVPALTGYRLTGSKDGGAVVELASFSTQIFSVMIDPGVWNFTIEASKNSVVFATGSIISREITGPTSLAFTLALTQTGNGTIDITVGWDAPGIVNRVETLIDGVLITPDLTITNNSVRYTALKPQGEYMVAFRLINSSNLLLASYTELVRVLPGLTSGKSVTMNSTTDFNRAPLAPTGLTAEWYQSSSTYGAVSLSWIDNANNETNNLLYFTVDGSSDFVTIPGGASDYTYFEAIRGKSYTFKLASKNSFGESSQSNVSSPLVIPALWTITLNQNLGTGTMGPLSAEGGKLFQLWQNWSYITRSGYTFLGWSENPSAISAQFTDAQVISMPEGDLTLYAVWELIPIVYTVIFDSQGAETPATPSFKTVTSPATTIDVLPTPPVRSGFTFDGWWDAPSGGGVQFFQITPVTASKTVFAKWIDSSPPTPGAAPSVSGITTTGFTITWPVATDNVSSESNLKYMVRLSNSGSFSTTVATAQGQGFSASSWLSPGVTTYNQTGLSLNTLYYIRVFVQDELSNVAMYEEITVTTLNPTYLHVSITNGDDTNGTGLPGQPYQTIGKALSRMTELSAIQGSEIRVAAGSYTAPDGNGYSLLNGISLIGGYTTNFSGWNPASNITMIEYTAGSGVLVSSILKADSLTLSAKICGFSVNAITPNSNAYGILINNSPNISIEECLITASTGNGTAVALLIQGIYAGKIERNTIQTENAPRYSRAIDLRSSAMNSTIHIYNNVIRAVNAGNSDCIGISINNGAYTLYVRNNTIIFGYGSSPGMGIGADFYSSGNPTLSLYADNNLFYMTSAGSIGYGIYTGDGTSQLAIDLKSVRNNTLIDCDDGIYRVKGGSTYTASSIALGFSAIASDNTDESGIGATFTLPGSGVWTLSGPTATIQTGALDGASLGWGYINDRAGVTRTGTSGTGWSRGAYEK